MGDMADYTIGCLFDDDSLYEHDPLLYGPSIVTCKHCKKTSLIWKQTKNKKWWMWDAEKDEWHTCESKTSGKKQR